MFLGAASVARAWSGYVDSFFDHALTNFTVETIGTMHAGYLAPFPDFLAFFVTLIYCSFLTLGVKGSAYFNSIFTLINLCVMGFVIVVGLYFADVTNWTTGGGFLPFGMSGVVAGAATCFYAFVGFDSIATAGEEARDPAQSIPRATLVSMTVVTAGYILVGATLTLMVPYDTLNPASAIPDAFAAHGASWAKYVVSIGALCGMTTTLFGSLFSLPRCVYAMAVDGLLFSWLARVSDKTKVRLRPKAGHTLNGLLPHAIFTHLCSFSLFPHTITTDLTLYSPAVPSDCISFIPSTPHTSSKHFPSPLRPGPHHHPPAVWVLFGPHRFAL